MKSISAAAGATVTTASTGSERGRAGAFPTNGALGRLKPGPCRHCRTISDNTKTILVDLQDSGDGGATFANSQPLIEATIPGVTGHRQRAADGQPIRCRWPPGLRGPIRLNITVPAGAGDNTAALLQADWANE